MATSTSSTRYLSGHPIWFELNADDEIENDDASIGAEKKNLTMTRIIDHMNGIASSTPNSTSERIRNR